MKVLGLVTEYNPFHNGHLHHLVESKRVAGASYSVAVMSGHFMQRGEPAIVDKWTRAAMAVSCGVDLVLELPTIYACSSADSFARGSVLLLDQLGCVTDLCFGSEAGGLKGLEWVGEQLAHPSEGFEDHFAKALSSGLSFASAQESALTYILQQSAPHMIDHVKPLFNQPNNVLGISYIKHLKKASSDINVHTIPRIGAGYLDLKLHPRVSSATGIRHHYFNAGDLDSVRLSMPANAYSYFENGVKCGRGPVNISDFEKSLMVLLKRSSKQELLQLPHMTEGLENRILACIQTSGTVDSFLHCVKNKRVPYTRLQRMLIHLLLNIQNKMASEWYHLRKPPYARILAFNDQGRKLIRICRKSAVIPLINKTASFEPDCPHTKELISLDFRASRIYGAMLQHPTFQNGEPDLLNSPVYVATQL